MTKTLTEQYKNKELSGWYYVKAKDGSINHWLLFTDSIEFDKDGDVKEVLAPVPSYDKLQTKDILLDSYKKENKRLNAVLKHIEKLAGEYVDELVDVKRKTEQLEKRLEIATKALKNLTRNCNKWELARKALKEMEGVK